jgi:hypothetical protein
MNPVLLSLNAAPGVAEPRSARLDSDGLLGALLGVLEERVEQRRADNGACAARRCDQAEGDLLDSLMGRNQKTARTRFVQGEDQRVATIRMPNR